MFKTSFSKLSSLILPALAIFQTFGCSPSPHNYYYSKMDSAAGSASGTPAEIFVIEPSPNLTPGQQGQLLAIVLDAKRNPVVNTIVSWTLSDGAGTLQPTTSRTDAFGVALTSLVLGPNTGTFTATARDEGVEGSTLFTVSEGKSLASTLRITAGYGQQAQVGTQLPVPLSVQALDESGAPVSGSSIVWTVTRSNGQLAEITTKTDESGNSTNAFILGTTSGSAGTVTDTVSATLENGYKTLFTETATIGPFALITFSSSSLPISQGQITIDYGQSVTLDYSTSDAYGNSIPNITLSCTWDTDPVQGPLSYEPSGTDGIAQVDYTDEYLIHDVVRTLNCASGDVRASGIAFYFTDL